jgi:hypothetical protein
MTSEYLRIPFTQATVAKTFFDFLYLRTWKGGRQSPSFDLAEDLHLNLEDFLEKDQD